MKIKAAILSVIITTFPGLLHGQSPITFEEVNNKFGIHSTSNKLRKNEEWKAYKGKCVEWIGELSDVTDMFSEITGITLGFKHLRSTFTYDVQISAPVSEKEKFMDLRIGSRYRYRATLRDYGGVIMPIGADWGCGTNVNTNIEYHGVVTTSDLSAVTEEDAVVLAGPVHAQADCAGWDTGTFFETARISDVTRCLQSGADPEARYESGSTPLHLAVVLGNAEIVVALATAGANLEARGEGGLTPLHAAALLGKAEVIEALLQAGSNLEARGEGGLTPLHLAGNAEIVVALATAGANLEARSEGGLTPLHTARDAAIVAALLQAGADPEARNEIGNTSLHAAAVLGKAKVIKALLQAGGDLEARGEGGLTPLHLAGNAEIVVALATAGANLEARSEGGLTPLHAAAARGKAEAIEALLQAGADPKALTRNGELPFDLIKDIDQIKGTDAYWKLNDARFE